MSQHHDQQPDILKAGSVKISLCLVLLILAVFSPYALTYILFTFVFAEDLKIFAFLSGIVLFCLSVPLTFWTLVRWGLSLDYLEARDWLKNRATTPLHRMNILVALLMASLIFFILWIGPF